MSSGLKLLTRIALFSALVYVLTWATSALPNVSFVFFVVFTAGFVWGAVPGLLVGIIGMGLASAFNPYGPANISVMIAQMAGISISAVVGAIFARTKWAQWSRMTLRVWLAIAGIICTILFYLPVNAVDAWLFQPFWPRFIAGAGWSLISVASNMIIFPLLFDVTRYLYERESGIQWRNA
jgi:uncharacterized membrane protein